MTIEQNDYSLSTGYDSTRWYYTRRDIALSLPIVLPAFEIDGRLLCPDGTALHPASQPVTRHGTVVEHRLETDRWIDANGAAVEPGVTFALTLRTTADSPVVRFRYALGAVAKDSRDTPARMTRTKHTLRYLGLPCATCSDFVEITLSEFDEMVHSYRPRERAITPAEIENGVERMGPIVRMALRSVGHADAVALIAYEHGSQTPDAFLRYRFDRTACVLEEAKSTFADGLPIEGDSAFESVWFDLAVGSQGHDELATRFREFVLRDLSPNAASREPYVFYNTWNYQERHQAWEHGKYLDTMKSERILAEIDVAHEMGIDVFVIDTGWYGKTGEWSVNLDFFPDGLDPIREKLERYGMKLGLWFSPRQAAVSSRIARDHLDCRSAKNGVTVPPSPVWETEESYSMCLVSRYWEAFADELIRCNAEYGVTYYKWDAVGQYGCDAANHYHGGPEHTAEERSQMQAFEQVRYMQKVIDKLCAAVPDAIVDFDITESGRSVGLAFLASGKYFLINNGPYYRSFDDPEYAPGGGMGSNVFVFPGPARPRVCRAPLGYDRYVPSVLFLTHYLPDDPLASQIVNLASLVLGQNGIWGDLLGVSESGVRFIGESLARYKTVRDDITEAAPVTSGSVASAPEIHEKISNRTRRGVVSIFSSTRGTYLYVTASVVADSWFTSPGVTVEKLPD
ncbi:MAG: hypothetical protein EA426_00525, partial [Spirochaetaceae bacterium]